jgi:hypothetical protein
MSVERLELSTNGLKGRCSTVELHARDGTFYHAAWDASTELGIENYTNGIARVIHGMVEFIKLPIF